MNIRRILKEMCNCIYSDNIKMNTKILDVLKLRKKLFEYFFEDSNILNKLIEDCKKIFNIDNENDLDNRYFQIRLENLYKIDYTNIICILNNI